MAAVVGIATPGLQNEGGEYNCFLNCILQCLWNCQELRPTILSWQPHHLQVPSCILGTNWLSMKTPYCGFSFDLYVPLVPSTKGVMHWFAKIPAV